MELSYDAPTPIPFDAVAILPEAGDNVAIAHTTIPAGTTVAMASTSTLFRTPHTVLEGHRFSVAPVRRGAQLLSWGLPFGSATSDIAPGSCICNERVVDVLRQRSSAAGAGPPGGLHVLPTVANFEDLPIDRQFDADGPGIEVGVDQVPRHRIGGDGDDGGDGGLSSGAFFEGYPRAGGRGVGTRNCIAVLGTTATTAGYCKEVVRRMNAEVAAGDPAAFSSPSFDGIVAVAHGEGGGGRAQPNNLELLTRTLAGNELGLGNTRAHYVDVRRREVPLARVRTPHTHTLHSPITSQGLPCTQTCLPCSSSTYRATSCPGLIYGRTWTLTVLATAVLAAMAMAVPTMPVNVVAAHRTLYHPWSTLF